MNLLAVKIAIFSQNHDEEKDLYADYSPILEELPSVKYYPKKDSDKNLYFQGIVIVDDMQLIRGLLTELGVSGIITPTDDGLVLTLLDSQDSEE